MAQPLIVLVHGAWHWGACFGKVSDRLALGGYAVACPDLVSHGYSDRTYDSVADMDDYVEPVARIVRGADAPVVLVGHSMGGATLSHLGERHPERIAKLVYLTAFMVPLGKTAVDYIAIGADDPATAELSQVMDPVERGLRLDVSKRDLVKAAFYADCSDHDVAVALRNANATTSTVPFQVPSAITPERFGRISRVYVECTADKAIPIALQRRMIADVPGAEVASLATSHSPFFSQPDELAAIIAAHA